MTSLMDKIELLIKKEKSSPERKKNEPIKSSNEILSELFGAFNAAPPKIEEIIPKKSKKGKKKHKKDKKKRSRSSSSDDSDDSDYSHRRKKRKKSKSKKRSSSPSYSPQHRLRSPKIKIDPATLLLNLNPEVKLDKSENIKVKQEVLKPEPAHMPKQIDSIKIEDSCVPNIDASMIPMPESPRDLDSSDLRLKLDGKKSDADEKSKGKIQIKNLKFSTVFEETVKQAEEQARRKAEKYEEGEYTDSSNESLKEVVSNTQFPKSADPGGILKKAAEDIKLPEEDKSHKKSSKKESSHKSSRREKEKEKTETKRSSSKSRRSRSRSASRRHGHFTGSRSRHRSSSRSRHRSSSRSRRRSRSRTRVYPHRHYSPPRYRGGGRRSSRSPCGVKLADSEKKRLLEVARRNAINMLKNGEVPGGTAALPPHTRNQVMAAIQSGGKSVDELTDFCKHLSKKEALGELSSVCSEDDGMSENEDTMAFHHPFLVKEKAPIIMNIRGGAPLPVKSTALVANKDELRLQFPVSSGSQHRDKASEWVPVEPKKDLPVAKLNAKSTPQPVPAPKAIEPATPIAAAPINAALTPTAPINAALTPTAPISAALTPTAPINAALTPTAPINAALTPTAPINALAIHVGASAITAAASQIAASSHPAGMSVPRPVPLALPAPPPAPVFEPPPYMRGFSSGSHLSTVSALPALPAPGPQAYPPGIVPPKIDISSIVSQKLFMIRQEQENKENPSKGFGWSKDRHLGQFTGSTGAQILTPRELAAGTQAWAKKDQLTRAAPVAGGMGMHLLQKMGWTPGRGLGKEGTGALQPLLLEVKLDTKGLQAKEEIPQRYHRGGKAMRGRGGGRGGSATPAAANATTAGGKHPVSILGEYCSKHKVGPPEYNLCFECGPDHKKNFLFKVRVNGIEYQPAVASQNKKQAKADAALLALQKLGLPAQ